MNQMAKVREYRNKHGMTMTHFRFESGLDLNYALFSKDTQSKQSTGLTESVLEGWETLESVQAKQEKRSSSNPKSVKPSPKKPSRDSLKNKLD